MNSGYCYDGINNVSNFGYYVLSFYVFINGEGGWMDEWEREREHGHVRITSRSRLSEHERKRLNLIHS